MLLPTKLNACDELTRASISFYYAKSAYYELSDAAKTKKTEQVPVVLDESGSERERERQCRANHCKKKSFFTSKSKTVELHQLSRRDGIRRLRKGQKLSFELFIGIINQNRDEVSSRGLFNLFYCFTFGFSANVCAHADAHYKQSTLAISIFGFY